MLGLRERGQHGAFFSQGAIGLAHSEWFGIKTQVRLIYVYRPFESTTHAAAYRAHTNPNTCREEFGNARNLIAESQSENSMIRPPMG